MTVVLDPPTILRSASERFDALSRSSRKAQAYVDDGPGKVTWMDGRLFALALKDHGSICSLAKENAKSSEKLLGAVGANLLKGQERYDQTEDDNLVQVNDIFAKLNDGQTAAPNLGGRGTATGFGSDLPGDHLKPPSEFAGIPEWVTIMMDMGGDLVSPAFWVGKVLAATIGVNPVVWFAEQFAGDWKGVSKAGDAFNQLSAYYERVAHDLTDDCGYLFRGWTGDASSGAQHYFNALVQAFEQQPKPLGTLGEAYETLGKGMYFTAAGTAALINVVLDLCVLAGATLAALVAAAASVIGAPIAPELAAALVAEYEAILGVWSTVLAIQAGTVGGCMLFAGLLSGSLSQIHTLQQVRMPSEG